MLSCLLAGIFAALSYPFSLLYEQPRLAPILMALALIFPINAASQQRRALAEKNLQFRRLAYMEITASLIGFLTALTIALHDGGVYALAAGSLSTATLGSLLAWRFLRTDPIPTLASDSVRPYLVYGGHRVGEQLWNTIRQQLDIFFASLVAPPAAVAMYSVPREQSLRIANSIINPVVTRVGLPVMSRLQGDAPALRAVYLQTMRFTASLNFPAYALLAYFSDEVVALLLGDQWTDAGMYMRILALWGLIRSTGNPSGSLLYAVGLVSRAHAWNFALLVGTAPLLWLAAKYGGLPALAWAMLALQIVTFFLTWRFLVRPACDASLWQYIRELMPPAIATLCSVVVAGFLTQSLAGPSRLLASTAILIAAYWLLSLIINRPWIRAMHQLADPVLLKIGIRIFNDRKP